MMRSLTARDLVDVGWEVLKTRRFCLSSIHSASRWPHELLFTSCQWECIASRSPISIEFRFVPIQSIENINRDFFWWRRTDNNHCVFFIGVEYIDSGDVIYIMETRKRFDEELLERLQDRRHQSYLNPVDSRWCFEPWSKKWVDSIIGMQASECPDVWIGCRNVLHKIFKMHS